MNLILVSTAAGLAIFHTAIGVDHYIPFVAMSKANKWSFVKTMLIVLICGAGHILASVILGMTVIWLGSKINFKGVDELRGNFATWFLIAFGLIYMLFGIKNAIKNKPHKHIISGGNEVWHEHKHDAHIHENDKDANNRGVSKSFWPLFIVLVLGPCETLIPLIVEAAALDSAVINVAAVTVVFSACTIATMLLCTAIVLKGVNMLPMKKIERYSHALAGFTVLMCGLAIMFLGI